MAIIGKLIKTGINLNQKLSINLGGNENPQRDQLIELLETAEDTAFGKYYGFRDILNSPDPVAAYKQAVPIHDYAKIHGEWWIQQQKHADVTWPGKPEFYALSSGTTGKSSKRIPVTDAFLQSMRSVGTSLIKDLPNFDFSENLFESEILMLSSTANLIESEHGFLEGEISGINVSNFPGWYDVFYRPGKEIAAIHDWDERLARIADEAPNWNIGAIAGIPSWVLEMLREVVRRHKLTSIHEIWPNLEVFASGGVAYGTYKADFEALYSRPVTVIDTYLASEGFFAYTARPGTLDMKLALEHGYFYEFIPFDERGVDGNGEILPDHESHGLSELEENTDYILVASTCAGAWRYVIGDTVRFTNLDSYELKITGRTKFFLNVFGSQLSEEKMDEAILEVSGKFGISVNEYIVSAIAKSSEQHIHRWVIVSNDEFDKHAFSEALDARLKDSNKAYRVARTKTLHGLELSVISKDKYHSYLASKKKKGGQVKTPKVMPEEKMIDFLESISV